MVVERGFRPRQKGVDCSVEGCSEWCVSNDLCSKHNMALSRYGSVDGKAAVKKVCKGCGEDFEHKYDSAEYCGIGCYRRSPENKKKAYEAVKRYRATKEGLRKARVRDRTDKRVNREKTLVRLPCRVCGDVKSEAHHLDNYDSPVNVEWLCKAHHGDVH